MNLLPLKKIQFNLNGQPVSVKAPPAYTLLEVLRDSLEVTGPKEDCSKGECGACTVILNGEAIASCLVLATQAEGAQVQTVESLAKNGELHPLQEEFIAFGASQCGHCIPGMIMSSKALLDSNPRPTLDEVKRALAGNICRCTGYISIFEAVLAASERMRNHDAR
jgi:carbon-monoxide dehydrogenase small subunit